MANLLTGDYGAVLQVSGATINRLLANMHQNAWEVTSNPSFPHSVGLRLGDDEALDGVRGAVWAQVGVPRMHLIDGSTNSFTLEVGLRIRYRPDEGTTPLPMYSHGTLRATYQITDIDPHCFGWGRVASQYMWLRVVDGSVSFEGEYADDELTATGLIDVPTANQQMTRQLGYLLAEKFAAAPQKLSDRFRQHLFKSIREIDGLISEASSLPWVPDVPIGGHAVAIPIDLAGGQPPPGSIDTIEHSLLGGRDLAAAVSRDTVMGMVQPAVDQLRAYAPAIEVQWEIGVEPFAYTDSTVYHVNIGQASADWIPQDSTAVIQLSASGHAHTESILPDFNFTLNYSLHMGFDPGSESLTLSAGGGYIFISGSVPLPSGVWDTISGNVSTTLGQFAAALVADPGVASALGAFSGYRAEVVSQLKHLDIGADAHFDGASFYLSGIVFRGPITVSRRWPVDVQFEKVDGDTISALKTWIPGGRIDHLSWTWSWTSSGHDPGGVAYDDRFVLRRPPSYGRFGPLVGSTPIPGLDGNGQVCLAIRGVVVDTVTGELVPISWDPSCREFGFKIPLRPGGWRLDTRNYLQVPPRGEPHPPGPVEIGLQEVTQLGTSSANTLVVFVHQGWTDGDARTLVDGVAQCTRQDAGLLVALVVADGALDPTRGDGASDVRAVAERLEAPIVVSEDVHGSWSRAFLVDGDTAREAPSWRLLSPDGGLLWKQDERIDAAELAAMLDGCLYPCAPASTTGTRVDVQLTPEALTGILDVGHGFAHTGGPPCPPHAGLHTGHMASIVSSVAFVRKDAASSMSVVDRLRTANEGRGADDPGVLLVVDGATDNDVRELSESLGPAFMVVGDPDGAVAAGAGVHSWPTTVPVGDQRGGKA